METHLEGAGMCAAAINMTVVIPHPTTDDQKKCIQCKKWSGPTHVSPYWVTS
jgi:hypothetical protein